MSKFTEETKENAYRAARAGGTQAEIAKACGVAERTYRKWLAKYPDFKEQVEHHQRRDTLPENEIERLETLKEAVLKWLENYVMSQGEVREVIETVATGDGNSVTTKRTMGKPPDLRLIDRILGNSAQESYTVNINLAEPDRELEGFESGDAA